MSVSVFIMNEDFDAIKTGTSVDIKRTDGKILRSLVYNLIILILYKCLGPLNCVSSFKILHDFGSLQ